MDLSVKEKMNDPINFNGTWVMKSSENQDEIMKRMGYKWPVRKIANAMSMSLVMENRTDGMFVSFQTILKNSDQTLSFEKSIQIFGLTSSEKITIKPIKIENGILYQTNVMDFPGMETFEVYNEYKITGNEMTLTQTIGDIVGKRILDANKLISPPK